MISASDIKIRIITHICSNISETFSQYRHMTSVNFDIKRTLFECLLADSQCSNYKVLTYYLLLEIGNPQISTYTKSCRVEKNIIYCEKRNIRTKNPFQHVQSCYINQKL